MGMIELLLLLVAIGVFLFFLEKIPMPDYMRILIRVVAGICVVYLLLNAFGLLRLDVPVPQLGRD